MNPKRQCQRTEPHAPHYFIEQYAAWADDCLFNCEGVNFVEFKVGDKVRTKVAVVTRIDTNSRYSIRTSDETHSYLPSELELVERPEPPLPDWLRNPTEQTSFITAAGNIIIWSGKNWINAITHVILTPWTIEAIYRRGETKRLVPEA